MPLPLVGIGLAKLAPFVFTGLASAGIGFLVSNKLGEGIKIASGVVGLFLIVVLIQRFGFTIT